jgi:FG-GAP repeat protein
VPYLLPGLSRGHENSPSGRPRRPGLDSRILVGDFTGDGKDDIAARIPTTGQWLVGQSNGSRFVGTIWGSWATAVHHADQAGLDQCFSQMAVAMEQTPDDE